MALHWNGCTLLQQDYQRSLFPETGLLEKMFPPPPLQGVGRFIMHQKFHFLINTLATYCKRSFAQSHVAACALHRGSNSVI